MAIYKSDIVDINLETGSIHRSFIKHTIGTADENADRFGVRVFRNGEAVDLSGCSCYGYFQNSNGDNIALTSAGTVDGNVAYITLPQACYNYEGNFCLAIKLLISGVTSTVRIVDGVVDNTNTGSAVAPTDAVPSYSEILDQYDAMVAATAVANGAIATTFNAATVYPAGNYVINNGALYRITADHAANVTWANTSKVATNFGAEVTGLKSAINILNKTNFIAEENLTESYALASDGTQIYSTYYLCSQFIPVKAGDIIKYGLYAATNRSVLCFYTTNTGTPTASESVAGLGTGSSNIAEGTYTVANNGFIRFSNYRSRTGAYLYFDNYDSDSVKKKTASLQNEIDSVESEILPIKNAIKDTTQYDGIAIDFGTFIEGEYFYNGVITSGGGSNSRRTDYIDISNVGRLGETVIYCLGSGIAYVDVITLFDENKNKILSVHGEDTSGNPQIRLYQAKTTENTKYMAVSMYAPQNYLFRVSAIAKVPTETVESKIEATESLLYGYESVITLSSYWDNTGNVASGTAQVDNFSRTPKVSSATILIPSKTPVNFDVWKNGAYVGTSTWENRGSFSREFDTIAYNFSIHSVPVGASISFDVEGRQTILGLKGQIDNLVTGSFWSNKKANFIGDSITKGVYKANDDTNAQANPTFVKIVETILGLSLCRNYGVSGTSISGTSETLPNDAFVNRYSGMDNDADLIVVLGGTNDYGTNVALGTSADTTDISFYGALDVLCRGLIEKYLGKRIVFVTPIPRSNESTNQAGATLDQYRQAIIDIAQNRYGLAVVDGRSLGISVRDATYRYSYIYDGLHPTQLGHNMMGQALSHIINSI